MFSVYSRTAGALEWRRRGSTASRAARCDRDGHVAEHQGRSVTGRGGRDLRGGSARGSSSVAARTAHAPRQAILRGAGEPSRATLPSDGRTFACGRRLIAFGHAPTAISDIRHIAVEFVHPVIVGKRALPAIGITAADCPLGAQLALLTEPSDIAVAFPRGSPEASLSAESDETRAAIAFARQRGCLTLAFAERGRRFRRLPAREKDRRRAA